MISRTSTEHVVTCQPYKILLLGTPLGKGRPRFTKSARTYTPPKTRAYETSLAWKARQVMVGQKIITDQVKVTIIAAFERPKSKKASPYHTKRPDIDNIIKIVLDSLNKIVWRDDCQIVGVNALKKYDNEPYIDITIEPLS